MPGSEIYIRLDAPCFKKDESDSSDGYDDFDLLEDLRNWTNKYKVTTVAVDALLKILQKNHLHLPLTCHSQGFHKTNQMSHCLL